MRESRGRLQTQAGGGSGPFKSQFQEYAKEIDERNDRRERIVKVSRDITQKSKKAIQALHRITCADDTGSIERVAQTLSDIREMIAAKVALEITDENYYVFHRAFTPCIQEYIEARTFLEYMQTKSLLTLESLQSEIHTACEDKSTAKLNVDTDDYVLGVADLTGELMRRAISIASEAEKICEFLVRIESSIAEIVEMGAGRREGNKKVSVLRQSVQKVEKACFDAAVQSAEVIGAE